jgi:hypothetical protein
MARWALFVSSGDYDTVTAVLRQVYQLPRCPKEVSIFVYCGFGKFVPLDGLAQGECCRCGWTVAVCHICTRTGGSPSRVVLFVSLLANVERSVWLSVYRIDPTTLLIWGRNLYVFGVAPIKFAVFPCRCSLLR